MVSTNSFKVSKRDGRTVNFDRKRIELAIAAAFKANQSLPEDENLERQAVVEIAKITDNVITALESIIPSGESIPVEAIQDMVETQLMRAGHYAEARGYIVYREERRQARLSRIENEGKSKINIKVKLTDGSLVPFDLHNLKKTIYEICSGLKNVHPEDIIQQTTASLYDEITSAEIEKGMMLASRSRIEKEPAYNTVACRLLLRNIDREALGARTTEESRDQAVREGFRTYLKDGIEAQLLDPQLESDFDLDKIIEALKPKRDESFAYLGLQTIYDRYLLHIEGRRIETPQFFFMRVAMGLSIKEGEQKEDRAIEFYNLISKFDYMSATPTLFNAGTRHPQLSSCYLTHVEDDLTHIFKCIGDNASLSKWAGGLGNDWTQIRATGAHIKGTNGESQGVIPFLKIVNDTAVAVNQGGKRKGAVCAYLESWHLDIEDFLDLRKNTGDDRRRTHDMHTANWIPDLFMMRVRNGEEWTLFSPNEVPDLHDLYGKAFEERYCEYEAMAARGEMRQTKKIDAKKLWRKMLSMLFETGHAWMTFKDPSNIRSPQDHAGVVHSSNLCTEILLNTSKDETAVCNLGSVNLVQHVTKDGGLDLQKLEKTISTAIRMLDNVIDINYYPTQEAFNANSRHRPIGLGIMGFQDAILKMRIPYASEKAVDFADKSMEAVSYFAILASSKLAAERGTYSTYEGSKWDRGILPIDSLELLDEERGMRTDVDRSTSLDWSVVRESVAENGIRNSNTMAIAPTATISNIVGVSQSIEPYFRNLFVKSNLSGDFTIVNEYLVRDLKALGIWDEEMIDDLKYEDGSVQNIGRIPDELKHLYATSFEIETFWLIECGARRQKWIDQGMSLNLYISKPSGKALNDMYFLAWEKGLKTTYYLRSVAATQIEKSNMDINKRGLQPKWMKSQSASSRVVVGGMESTTDTSGASPEVTDNAATAPEVQSVAAPAVEASEVEKVEIITKSSDELDISNLQASGNICSIDNPDCEACQ